MFASITCQMAVIDFDCVKKYWLPLVIIKICSYMALGSDKKLFGRYIYGFFVISRQAVVSREAKKKQHAYASSSQCDHYSELFTRMVGLNF